MKVPRAAMPLTLCMVAMTGFATEPSAPTAISKAPAATAAPQAPVAGTAVQAPAAAATPGTPTGPTAAGANDAAATAKAAHALGYSPKQRKGKTVYCKAEASLGTRLESMKCFTAEEMTAVVQRSIANQDSVSKMQRTELYQEGRQ